jgi:HSP20 family protein
MRFMVHLAPKDACISHATTKARLSVANAQKRRRFGPGGAEASRCAAGVCVCELASASHRLARRRRPTMANLMIKKQSGGQPAAAREWDPIAWARELLKWDPFREMAPSFAFETPAFMPAFDVKETKDAYEFRADVPGVAEKDLDIRRTGNRLTISGKRESEKEDKGDTYYSCERSYGSFTRAFTLPEGIDAEHIRADLKDGVLTIVVPRKPEAQPQKISFQATERKS